MCSVIVILILSKMDGGAITSAYLTKDMNTAQASIRTMKRPDVQADLLKRGLALYKVSQIVQINAVPCPE
jgi:hypothetical protein